MRVLQVSCTASASGSAKDNSVAAYSDTEKKLVIVSLNTWSVVHCIEYDLSRFTIRTDSEDIKCWSTDIDLACVTCRKATKKPTAYMREEADEKAPDTLKSEGVFKHWFDSRTIKTFEICGLDAPD